jgi:short-chain Z-isoprenyl diphosphate synthase
MRMSLRIHAHALHRLYAYRIRRQLRGGKLPRHVGVIMDGNRRWARRAGLDNPSIGYRHGADRLNDLLRWCTSAGIGHVTVFVCSTENLVHRDATEVAFLMGLIEELAGEVLGNPEPGWCLHVAGRPDALPDRTATVLKEAVAATETCRTGSHLTLAIGYGGRQELLDAMRELLLDRAGQGCSLEEVAESITAQDITDHLYTAGQPEPDLIIRTSGEQRLSNFMLWQSAYSELYFCDAYWPAFREIDFLRALRSYAGRHRRYGR